MLHTIVLLLLNTLAFFLTLMLLARFVMQWQRLSFRNQLGNFVIVTTDWAVRPLRRVIPPLGGLDLPSLVGAWLVQMVFVGIEFALLGANLASPMVLFVALPLAGLLALARVAIYLVMAVVLISVIISWINPHSPMAPAVNALAEPFLRPFRRVIPPIANVDLSPLILLLVLQILLIVLGELTASLLPLMR